MKENSLPLVLQLLSYKHKKEGFKRASLHYPNMAKMHRMQTITKAAACRICRMARRRGLAARLYKGGLGHYVSIYVPSTRNKTQRISASAFGKRVRSIELYMSRRFGGETTIPTSGGYFLKKGQFVREPVKIVKSFTNLRNLRKYSKSIRQLVAKDKKIWGQQSVGVESDKRFYFA